VDEENRVLDYFHPEWKGVAARGLEELGERAKSHARLNYPRSTMEATLRGYLPEQFW